MMIGYREMYDFARWLNTVLKPYITTGSYIDRTYFGEPFYYGTQQCCRYSAYVASERIANKLCEHLNLAFCSDPDIVGRAFARMHPQKSGDNAGQYKVEVKFW